ncbi:hypothetical protein CB1_000306028 [Camelus ferus]|nr:hypothetical protein CB1_000306028 [Camelus ferus]
MTDLLRSVVTVIDVFYKYTKQDGECDTLSKNELKELLEKEFRPILKNPDDPDTVDVIMHMLDRDHDRRLDFTEFLLMVFKLAMACNKVDLKGKDTNLAVPSQVINQEAMEDKVMDVSQEISPLDTVNMSLDPVASLLVRKDMDLEHVEDNREQVQGQVQMNFPNVVNVDPAQVSPLALDNMDLAQVSPLALDNMGQALGNLAMANTVQAQVNPLPLANMDLAQVSLLALGMGQVQVSLLALDNKGQAQVSPLALDKKGQFNLTPPLPQTTEPFSGSGFDARTSLLGTQLT